jgi:hypothetical protein
MEEAALGTFSLLELVLLSRLAGIPLCGLESFDKRAVAWISELPPLSRDLGPKIPIEGALLIRPDDDPGALLVLIELVMLAKEALSCVCGASALLWVGLEEGNRTEELSD